MKTVFKQYFGNNCQAQFQLASLVKLELSSLSTDIYHPPEKSAILIDLLDVEDVIAQLLVTEGYVTIESIVSETPENLEKIEGFDNELANEILSRAKNSMQQKSEEDKNIVNEKIHDEDLKGLSGMTTSMLALLAKDNIVNLNDFADLASYELIDKEEGIFRKLELDEDLVNQMIMDAREKSFY